MVGPANFNDLFLLRKSPRCSNGSHHPFGARAQHPEHFNIGHQALDELRQFQLVFMEQSRHRPTGLQHFNDFGAHRFVIAT